MQIQVKDDSLSANDIRLHWEEIARSEVTRHRRRLSLLTEEQQTTLESLLVSVADHMFEVVVQRAEEIPGVDRSKYYNVWRPAQAA